MLSDTVLEQIAKLPVSMLESLVVHPTIQNTQASDTIRIALARHAPNTLLELMGRTLGSGEPLLIGDVAEQLVLS